MSVPNIYYLKLTEAGKAEAIKAADNLLQVQLTHIGFGTGQYDPNGLEAALFNEVKRVPLAGGSRPKPNQMRVAGAWVDNFVDSEIGEVGLFAGNVLFAVWSRSVGGPIGHKTSGVDFVVFCEVLFDEIPASSIELLINPDVGEALSALTVHRLASDAHSQYLQRSEFVNGHRLMLADTVGGSPNAITLAMPAEISMPGYAFGQRVAFVATAANTGPVVVNINGLGNAPVRKAGTLALSPGDIAVGTFYSMFFDGIAWQITSGVGSSSSMAMYSFTATAGQTEFTAPYLPGGLIVTHNGGVLAGSNFLGLPTADQEYTADDGEKVVLKDPAAAGDIINLFAFNSFAVANTWTKAEADARYALKSEIEGQHAGEIGYFSMTAPPVGWLRANGATVSRTTYAALFAAIGTRFGAGDNATTFRLPDLRGEFLRGWDDGRGVDAGRQLGSAQADEIKAHQHATTDGQQFGYANQSSWAGRWLIDTGALNTTNIQTGITGGNETRPRNVAMLACIRF